MADLQLYSLLYVTANGKLLVEEGSVTINRETASQPIKTTAKGYAGESPGAGMIEVDVTNAIPAAGFEFLADQFMNALEPLDIGLLGPGGKQLSMKGFIVSDSIKHSVNSESSYDFKFRAPFSVFQ